MSPSRLPALALAASLLMAGCMDDDPEVEDVHATDTGSLCAEAWNQGGAHAAASIGPDYPGGECLCKVEDNWHLSSNDAEYEMVCHLNGWNEAYGAYSEYCVPYSDDPDDCTRKTLAWIAGQYP